MREVKNNPPGSTLPCSVCGDTKDVSEFNKQESHRARPDMEAVYKWECRVCHRAMSKLVKRYTDPVTGKRRRKYPTKAEILAYLGKGAPTTKPLASAGHKRRRRSSVDPEVSAAWQVIREARARRKGDKGYVYLMTDGTAYKIGFSTDPEHRPGSLQTGNPRPITLLAYFPGTEADEKETQQRFIEHNILQEWFRPRFEVALYFFGRKDVVRP